MIRCSSGVLVIYSVNTENLLKVLIQGSLCENTWFCFPPEVSLFQEDSSSPVVCHATGFYPKTVNINWQKNGEDLDEGVELRDATQPGTSTPESYNTAAWRSSGGSLGIVIGAIVAVLLLAVIGCVGLIIRKKRESNWVTGLDREQVSTSNDVGPKEAAPAFLDLPVSGFFFALPTLSNLRAESVYSPSHVGRALASSTLTTRPGSHMVFLQQLREMNISSEGWREVDRSL
ncbi:hypothetical protein NFI96_009101 [Prochilodus magdalenae]|nr:hypothetical protein NFI96_009101 [Prochilodus magdalenae]